MVDRRKMNYVGYILLVVAAFVFYYGFLNENCGCENKLFWSMIIGIGLFLGGMVMIK